MNIDNDTGILVFVCVRVCLHAVTSTDALMSSLKSLTLFRTKLVRTTHVKKGLRFINYKSYFLFLDM